MWFWALDQRDKWRAKWREEAQAEGRAEGHAEGHAEGRAEGQAEGRVQGQADLLNQMWATARSEGNQELVAQVERIAREKDIALGDPQSR